MTAFHVTFLGICTHIWEDQPTSNEAWGRRIVVPNASSRSMINVINTIYRLETPIAPHLAQLSIPVEQYQSQEGPLQFEARPNGTLVAPLRGVTVTVPGIVDRRIRKDARCMPGLGSFVAGIAPGPVASSAHADDAACYFDFKSGIVLGRSLQGRGGAGCILYESETASPINPPMITVTPFDGSPETTIYLQLAPDGPLSDVYMVIIQNLPESGIDDNANDFILHYLVADKFPEHIPTIGAISCIQHPNIDLLRERWVHYDIGFGCSNSNLP